MKKLPVVPAGRRWALALASAGGVIALAAGLVPAASAASAQGVHAAHISGTATYHAKLGHVTRLGLTTHGFQGFHAVGPRTIRTHAVTVTGSKRVNPFRSPGGPDPAGKATGLSAPNVRTGIVTHVLPKTSAVSVIEAFNGLSSLDSNNIAGFTDTPPDQGLCVGFDHSLPSSPKVVFEIINSALRETGPAGNHIYRQFDLATAFADPNNIGDSRCLYDPKTASFYFTEIGVNTLGDTTVDVTVLNSKGPAFYQVDTSNGGNCFGDQPKTGFDNNALVVSTDEYCGSNLANYEGAIVIGMSKKDLVAESTTLHTVTFGPVSLGGIPGLGLDPAINTTTGTSYLVNSFPFNAAGNNNPVSNSLGLWKLTGDSELNTGKGLITLSGKVIGSEYYAFPVPANSTGNGTTDVNGITSEATLNPDDSRTSGPVMVTKADDGSVQLWTALDTAAAVSGDPTSIDGAAWFKISTGTQKVVSQGYVVSKGANLLYPAVMAPASGPAAMVFTETSATINPSAAYTVLGSGKVTIIGAGAGAHLSFCDSLPTCPGGRWGDYSFVAPDPVNNGIWMATEYIPPVPDQNPFDNWGTYVFKLSK